MPHVGNKKFSYTRKGIAKAKKFAKKIGKKVNFVKGRFTAITRGKNV